MRKACAMTWIPNNSRVPAETCRTLSTGLPNLKGMQDDEFLGRVDSKLQHCLLTLLLKTKCFKMTRGLSTVKWSLPRKAIPASFRMKAKSKQEIFVLFNPCFAIRSSHEDFAQALHSNVSLTNRKDSMTGKTARYQNDMAFSTWCLSRNHQRTALAQMTDSRSLTSIGRKP